MKWQMLHKKMWQVDFQIRVIGEYASQMETAIILDYLTTVTGSYLATVDEYLSHP